MNKKLKSLLLGCALFFTLVTPSTLFAQDPCAGGGCLPPVTLSCQQHTVDFQINLGIVSFTYKILVTVCDNGTEYYDLIRA